MFDRETMNQLYRYCRALCEQESDAFDLLQNALERCIKSPPRDEASAYRYALRVVRNRFIDDLRSKQRITFESLEESGAAIDIDLTNLEEVMLDRDELENVWAMMTGIEREILYLWAVEGYSTDEVASHLGKPRNTVLSIIHRMRQRLRRDLRATNATGSQS